MTGDRPGDVLCGRFVVEGPPLGQGLGGVVLPVHDEVADRSAAAKVLHDHLVSEPRALAALRAEAGAAATVRHRNLLVVYGLWSDLGRQVLVTERLEPRPPPTHPLAVIEVGIQLAGALAAIHDAGHVHGDVRTAHVVHTRRGAVLLGFGAASVRGPAPSKPGQTAPEVALGGPRSVQADLYGLGVVLYELLAGHLPYGGPTPWAVLGAQQARRPKLPTGPRGLGRLVIDLLHPEPDQRPPTAAAVRDALTRLARFPRRRVHWEGVLGPIDLLRGFAVHGVDPETGAPALVASGLGRRQAAALVQRLGELGWTVRASREALGPSDLAIVLAGTVLAGVFVPIVGHLIAFVALSRWRTGRLRPRLRLALPPPRTPVPPRQEPAGTEHAVVVGALLLCAAVLLKVAAWFALVPLLLAALVVAGAWRARRDDALTALHRHRIRALLTEARLGLEHAPAIGDLLALQGEIEALEADWAGGRVDSARAVEQATRLRDKAWAAPRPVGSGVVGVSRSLRGDPDTVTGGFPARGPSSSAASSP